MVDCYLRLIGNKRELYVSNDIESIVDQVEYLVQGQ